MASTAIGIYSCALWAMKRLEQHCSISSLTRKCECRNCGWKLKIKEIEVREWRSFLFLFHDRLPPYIVFITLSRRWEWNCISFPFVTTLWQVADGLGILLMQQKGAEGFFFEWVSSASSIHSYNIHPSILIRLMNLRAFGGALNIELKGCISMTYHLIYRCPVRWSPSNHQIWRHQSGLFFLICDWTMGWVHHFLGTFNCMKW